MKTINADDVIENVKGIVRGKELPFPADKVSPCNGLLTPSCPLKENEQYVFSQTVKVKPFYPAIPIRVKYSLMDPNENLISCLEFGAKIIDPNPRPKNRGRKRKPN
ncbi:uncharacterized protein B4U79_17878 [Dinothrombium tinctorium]|uniref:MD-2-related lipid-recognition domain-containing protein n=1 Tax=Dinothrombium tinctorium TaxID=1965070 RepID=A0A3S3PTR7_9ACAR|nr:uncharacterized protein B4U79_17879 [Dinothrombium tinctorium]RWS16216.1 uncharacterized protein B4U79_17878 [Dinothrombium tinctorium]